MKIFQKEYHSKDTYITNLIRRTAITYSVYFQKKYSHSGVLFEGKFKNVFVKSESQLLQLSKHIHLNPLKLAGSELFLSYDFSSYKYYAGSINPPKWINTQIILAMFSKSNANSEYKRYVEAEFTKNELKPIETLTIGKGSRP